MHAICDAIFGAAALGDIGDHFPDTDPAYKNIDSKILLSNTIAIINIEGYSVINIDATVCLESPKIKPYAEQMRKIIAEIACIQINDVSVKATTTEQMGFAGREEGLYAYATVLLNR